MVTRSDRRDSDDWLDVVVSASSLGWLSQRATYRDCSGVSGADSSWARVLREGHDDSPGGRQLGRHRDGVAKRDRNRFLLGPRVPSPSARWLELSDWLAVAVMAGDVDLLGAAGFTGTTSPRLGR